MARHPKHPTKSKKVGVLIEEYVYERVRQIPGGDDFSWLINDLLKQYVVQYDRALDDMAEGIDLRPLAEKVVNREQEKAERLRRMKRREELMNGKYNRMKGK